MNILLKILQSKLFYSKKSLPCKNIFRSANGLKSVVAFQFRSKPSRPIFRNHPGYDGAEKKNEAIKGTKICLKLLCLVSFRVNKRLIFFHGCALSENSSKNISRPISRREINCSSTEKKKSNHRAFFYIILQN